MITFVEEGRRDDKFAVDGMNEFVAPQVKRGKALLLNSGDKLNADTAISNEFLKISDSIQRKCLKYVMDHGNSCYSFYYFRRNIVPAHAMSPDSVLSIFNTVFPDET